MNEHGIGDLPPLTIRRIRGVIESGARLHCHAPLGLPEQSAGYSYENGPHSEIVNQKH